MRRLKNWPILIGFLTVAVLGILITPHYGKSWDELKFYKYADLSLQAYATWPTTGQVPEFGNTYDNYGPAYVMLVGLGARAFQPPHLLEHLRPAPPALLRHFLGRHLGFLHARQTLAESKPPRLAQPCFSLHSRSSGVTPLSAPKTSLS